MSTTTRRGAWNAPARFLPSGRSQPVLPPVEASTIASSVVGTLIQPMPRIHVAAAKPVRSPVTPPPRATTVSFRPSPAFANEVQSEATVPMVLWRSPDGMVAIGESPSFSDQSLATVSSATTRRPARTAGAMPRPTTTSELPRSNQPATRFWNEA